MPSRAILVGWAGSSSPSHLVVADGYTAASPLKLLGFSAADFRLLESEDDSFRSWLNQRQFSR